MLDVSKHKKVMVKILKDIYSDVEIASLLGFKGGTACYLFHDLPRFSVDLDFDLLDLEKEDLVLEKVKKIVEDYGVVKDARKKRYTIFLLLSYGDGERNIKVEISRRKSISSYETKNYLGIPMLVMKKEDMFANKLLALTQRKKRANRDLFDIWFFFEEGWEINEEIVKERSGEDIEEYIEQCISYVGETSNKYILHGVGELLGDQKKRWVKKNLKDELLFSLRYYLKER